MYLPKNTTSVLQPLDQGIIAAFKVKYRNLLSDKLVNSMDISIDQIINHENQIINLKCDDILKKINLFDVLTLLAKSWYLISENTIKNC